MPEIQARRRLSGRIASFSVLAPFGPFAGRGILRVLRARAAMTPESVELVCGYDSYERLG